MIVEGEAEGAEGEGEGTSREEEEAGGMIGIVEGTRGEVEEGIGGTIGEVTGMIEEDTILEEGEGEMMEDEDGRVARVGIGIVEQLRKEDL